MRRSARARFASGIYSPSERFLHHPDPAIRALVSECGNAEARAAAMEAMATTPWESQQKLFYGPAGGANPHDHDPYPEHMYGQPRL